MAQLDHLLSAAAISETNFVVMLNGNDIDFDPAPVPAHYEHLCFYRESYDLGTCRVNFFIDEHLKFAISHVEMMLIFAQANAVLRARGLPRFWLGASAVMVIDQKHAYCGWVLYPRYQTDDAIVCDHDDPDIQGEFIHIHEKGCVAHEQ